MTKTYLITPGELDGIGLEVSLEALKKIDIHDAYIIFVKKSSLNSHLEKISLPFKLTELKSLNTDLSPGVYFIDLPATEPVDWFKKACEFSAANPTNTAVVTGPLRKASFNDPKILGHTEYLRQQFKNADLFMTFFGKYYNCLLLSDHVPLKDAPSHLSSKKINASLNLLRSLKPEGIFALLGLNPHAGESGLLGNEEEHIHKKVCSENTNLLGPLSPDGLFSVKAYEQYDFLIANYHDQGLIPFKLINGFNASQATLGLPFVRTSVNHGTSESLFMKSEVDSSSMLHAIQLAQHLLHLKNTKDKHV